MRKLVLVGIAVTSACSSTRIEVARPNVSAAPAVSAEPRAIAAPPAVTAWVFPVPRGVEVTGWREDVLLVSAPSAQALPPGVDRDVAGAVRVNGHAYGDRVLPLVDGDRVRIATYPACDHQGAGAEAIEIRGAFHGCAATIYREGPAQELRWSLAVPGEWAQVLSAQVLPSGDLAIAGWFRFGMWLDGHALGARWDGYFAAVIDVAAGRVRWIDQLDGTPRALAATSDELWIAQRRDTNGSSRTQVVRYGADGRPRARWRELEGTISHLRVEADGTLVLIRAQGSGAAAHATLERRTPDGELASAMPFARGEDIPHASDLDPIADSYITRLLTRGSAACGDATWTDGLREGRLARRFCRIRPDGSSLVVRVADRARSWQLADAMYVRVQYPDKDVLYRFPDAGPTPPPYEPDATAARAHVEHEGRCPAGWGTSYPTGRGDVVRCRHELSAREVDVSLASGAKARGERWMTFRCADGERMEWAGELFRQCWTGKTGGAPTTKLALYPDGRVAEQVVREGAQLVGRGWSPDGTLTYESRANASGAPETRARIFDPSGALQREDVPGRTQEWSPSGVLLHEARTLADGTFTHETYFPDGTLARSTSTPAGETAPNGLSTYRYFHTAGRVAEECTIRGATMACTEYAPDGRERGKSRRDARGRWSRVSGQPTLPDRHR